MCKYISIYELCMEVHRLWKLVQVAWSLACSVVAWCWGWNHRFQVWAPNLDPYPLLSGLWGLHAWALNGIWYVVHIEGFQIKGPWFEP